jgi:hypothetical protein
MTTTAERTQRLLVALGALVLFQALHLLDELRTEEDRTGLMALVSPQAIAGIGGAVLALIAVRRGLAWGRPTAIATAVLVGLGFLLTHGMPWSAGLTEPYWGDGSADIAQWAGVIGVWASCIAVFVRAREWHPAAAEPALA